MSNRIVIPIDESTRLVYETYSYIDKVEVQLLLQFYDENSKAWHFGTNLRLDPYCSIGQFFEACGRLEKLLVLA
jgi:hypothetical protein